MPLIMNDDMDLDINDLFDDGTVLPLPSRPPPKELFQRVDELRGSGCHQGIAWSKLGSVASISQSGAGLEFRTIRCHPVDGSWDLSEPTLVSQVIPAQDGISLQHLCWSPNGSDLAAIDAVGRVSIFSIGTFMNKPSLARSGLTDSTDDLHAVVGAYWLNLLPAQNRPPIVTSLAVKNDKEYRYESSQASCFGPIHPDYRKSALICLTTGGDLRLFWPQSDGKWYETSSEIESVASSNDLITHAAICADKNQTLLVAFATTTKQLRTVRVFIKWGNKPVEKAINPPPVTVNPLILVGHLAVTNWMDGEPPGGSDSFHLQSSMAALSCLEIIPPTPEASAGPLTLPTIITVRSYLPISPSHFNQEIHSTIDRWELRESTQAIHPAFEQLGSRRRNSGSQPSNATTLKKLDGITVNKVVIYVQAVALDRILCFAYSDGSFEYRDRASLAETFTEGGPDRFIHLSQIGFSYEDDEPCLQLALSPTNCSFIQIGCDGKFKWRTLRHHLEQMEDLPDDAQYRTVIAGLTMSCSAAVMTNSNYDDILAIGHRYTSRQTFSYDLQSEICRNLNFSVDYSDESHHDTLIRNPSVQLCLTVQNSLGFYGDTQPRSFGAKIAWISLQARNCIVLMTMASSMKVPDPGPQKRIAGLEDPEVIRILSGTARWCLDLMAWIVDSLLHPEDASIFKPLAMGQSVDLNSFHTRLRGSSNVALHLLLSSAPRSFLTAICRRLTNLDYVARKAMSTTAQSQAGAPIPIPPPLMSSTLRAAYSSIATLTSDSVINLRAFEAFLTSISASVKDAYTTAGLHSSAPQTQPQQQTHTKEGNTRNAAEQSMLFGGPLPAALVPAMRHIFTTLLPTLRSGTDPAKLFFNDFSLLALDPITPSSTHSPSPTPPDHALASLLGPDQQQQRKKAADLQRVAHTIDIFQRIPITLGQEAAEGPVNENGVREKARDAKRWRRCARCTAVMEDYVTQRPGVHFLVLQERRCFCAGTWNLLTGKQIVI